MCETNDDAKKPASGREIDLAGMVDKVWAGRKLVFRACGIAAVAGVIAAFSIPKEYTTTVLLTPEMSGRSTDGMTALASMAGLNLGNAAGSDALSPSLYPEIVNSTPFVTGLFPMEIAARNGELQTSLSDYMSEHQRSPWWNAVISAPFKLLGWAVSLVKGEDEDESADKPVDAFRLTRRESDIMNALRRRIYVYADKTTRIVEISVTMQDPVVSAVLADTVTRRLQGHITDYRTNKARQDLDYAESLYREAQSAYYDALRKYAAFTDANQNLTLQVARTQQLRLQNDMNLAYGVYTQVAQQLQLAKAKVQEITPVYAIIQPASVPLRPSSPSKAILLIGFVLLAGAGSAAWILFCGNIKCRKTAGTL